MGAADGEPVSAELVLADHQKESRAQTSPAFFVFDGFRLQAIKGLFYIGPKIIDML